MTAEPLPADSARAALGSHHPARAIFARRAVALAVTALALALIATMAWGDTLVARNRAAAAMRLPGNTRLAGQALLDANGSALPDGGLVGVAHAALRNSPVSGEALTLLALDARAQGREKAAVRLLDLSGRMGWHDETGQRQLFNLAVAHGDATNALYHADALLRQGLARDELFASFNAATGDARLRRAMAPYIIQRDGWARDWLVANGARLSDAALDDLLTRRAKANRGLDRDVAAPIIIGLIGAGRHAAAAGVWRRVAGASGTVAGPLSWDERRSEATATPFDWTISGGLALSETGELTPAASGEAGAARRLLALPPGRYRLSFAGPAQSGWRWAFACGVGQGQPSGPLPANATIAVPESCPVQILSIAPTTINAAAATPLGTPTVTRLP